MTHDNETLRAFYERIDCRFPYNDHLAASALIGEARSISTQAVFIMLHEICRAPRGERVTQERQRELLGEWRAGFDHPLKDPLTRCAEALISGHGLPCSDCAQIMGLIAQHYGQYAALNIAQFAADDAEVSNTKLERVASYIKTTWQAKCPFGNAGY